MNLGWVRIIMITFKVDLVLIILLDEVRCVYNTVLNNNTNLVLTIYDQSYLHKNKNKNYDTLIRVQFKVIYVNENLSILQNNNQNFNK